MYSGFLFALIWFQIPVLSRRTSLAEISDTVVLCSMLKLVNSFGTPSPDRPA